uniref:Uncharacterized protein n=1 Tax=Octopus bimaculoides TaxID=37653 RepID=A0A0L8FI33_OCTBM
MSLTYHPLPPNFRPCAFIKEAEWQKMECFVVFKLYLLCSEFRSSVHPSGVYEIIYQSYIKLSFSWHPYHLYKHYPHPFIHNCEPLVKIRNFLSFLEQVHFINIATCDSVS